MRRKKEASKIKQTNKAKQHSTPKAVTFPRKNELPQVMYVMEENSKMFSPFSAFKICLP